MTHILNLVILFFLTIDSLAFAYQNNNELSNKNEVLLNLNTLDNK